MIVRITAVIPTYNRAKFIDRAIESMLGQSRPPDEILVIDDGSTDGTRDVVARFEGEVRYIYQVNAGASVARNRGVREAKYDWIAFVDSDDYWLRDHLRRMVVAIDATRGQAGFYFADLKLPSEEGGQFLWNLCGFEVLEPYRLAADATQWAMMALQPMMLQTAVIKRSVYLAAGGLMPALRCRHDTHLFLKLSLGMPACAVAGCGAEMTSDDRSGGRMTTKHGPATVDYWRETIMMYEDILMAASTIAQRYRRDLRVRIATAHLRLARHAFRSRDIVGMGVHIVRAARSNPRRFLQGLARTVRNFHGSPWLTDVREASEWRS